MSPRRSSPPSDRAPTLGRMLPLLGRVVLVAAAGALAVAAAGGGDAFWLSVPLALLVAGPAGGPPGAVGGAPLGGVRGRGAGAVGPAGPGAPSGPAPRPA